MAGTPTAVGAPSVAPAPVQPQSSAVVPFRAATLERDEIVKQITGTLTTSQQPNLYTIEGSGFMYGLEFDFNFPSTSNSVASVTFTEDAPWNVFNWITLEDVTGQVLNLSGYHLHLLTQYGGWEAFDRRRSLDPNVWQYWLPGSLDTGLVSSDHTAGQEGAFRFHQKLPVALNRRDLVAVMGNQDRSQKWDVRVQLDTVGTVFSTAPTTKTFTWNTVYDSYAVPTQVNDGNTRNQVVPPTYGVIHYGLQATSEAVPTGSATINHWIRRLGNTIRLIILVFRSNAVRGVRAEFLVNPHLIGSFAYRPDGTVAQLLADASPTSLIAATGAEAAMPTQIIFKVGDQTIFTEDTATRRSKMFDRYGFDAPPGVLVYDFIHDFDQIAGHELGHDYLYTQDIVNAQFQCTYPSGMGSTNNSLTVITSDMTIPPGIDIYNPLY